VERLSDNNQWDRSIAADGGCNLIQMEHSFTTGVGSA